MFPFPTTLVEFVAWMAVPGAFGVIVALLLERNAKFKAWKSPWKGKLVMLGFVLFPFIAYAAAWAIRTVNPAILLAVGWVLATAMQGLIGFASSQFAHYLDPEAKKEPVSQ